MSPGCGCGFGVLASRSACISVRASVAVFILWCQPHSHWRLDSRWLSPCWMWSQSVPCAVHRVPSCRSASHCPPARLRVSSRSCGQLLGSRECLSDCVHRDCAMWAAPRPCNARKPRPFGWGFWYPGMLRPRICPQWYHAARGSCMARARVSSRYTMPSSTVRRPRVVQSWMRRRSMPRRRAA